MNAPIFTPSELAGATSAETAVVIPDYPYGFRLRCQMRVWVEFRKGKGFRYVTQTSNPKVPGLVWNKPKAGTYWRVSLAIAQKEAGHLVPAGLSEYASLPEYVDFLANHGPALSPDARASLTYFQDCKAAHERACAEQGVTNIFDAHVTPEQRAEIKRAGVRVMIAHHKAGTDY